MLEVEKIRGEFPILERRVYDRPLVYLDNGATAQKPRCVIDKVDYLHRELNANIHRGVHLLSEEATERYEQARQRIASFIGAAEKEEVIFTAGATASLNAVAYAWGGRFVHAGDNIVVSEMEHHSNLVPWQMLAERCGAEIRMLPFDDEGRLMTERLDGLLDERTKVVAVTQASNTLGTRPELRPIIDAAHAVGAVAVVDGCQGVVHGGADVQALDCDFYAFSGHKLYGPTGIGVLYGKYDILDAMPPFLRGGDMIEYVEEQDTTYAELPAKFEAGTQNVGGAAGLTAAIDYLETITFDRIEAIEKDLVDYALPQLRELPYIELYGCDTTRDNKTGIIAFNVKDVHPHDVASILDSYGVAIRAGHHCAQPLHRYLGQNASCRASFYLYNTREDIDRWIDALKKVRGVLGYGA